MGRPGRRAMTGWLARPAASTSARCSSSSANSTGCDRVSLRSLPPGDRPPAGADSEQTTLSRFTDDAATAPGVPLDAFEPEEEIYLAESHNHLASIERMLFGEPACPSESWGGLDVRTRQALIQIRVDHIREELVDVLAPGRADELKIRGFE